MLDRVVNALVKSKNEAADDTLLEAMRLGVEKEKHLALDCLLRRQTVRGLSGVVEQYEQLPQTLQVEVLGNLRTMHHAVRESGRSDRVNLRLAAMKLIAISRQGKLAYVVAENLSNGNEQLSKGAVEAMVALARWVATESRRLQRGNFDKPAVAGGVAGDSTAGAALSPGPKAEGAVVEPSAAEVYRELMEQRPEIEQAVVRAMDLHRGRHGSDLLRAALLLCDWAGSKTLAILHTAKHAGQSPMVRRLQQPPVSEHVDAFLLGASHGGLRSHFGIAFSQIEEGPVLDALLRKTHWLKDGSLQLCMQQVTRGAWLDDGKLAHDIERRNSGDAARIGEWIGSSGTHDDVQDGRLDRLRQHCRDDFAARLQLLRVAARRKRGSSVQLFRSFLADSDERLVRIAVREIVRRHPPDYENMLLHLMTGGAESVRRIIARAVGEVGFEQYWARFDRLDHNTRKQAGKAMLKILPDAVARLARRLGQGTTDQRLKALSIVQELQLATRLEPQLTAICEDPQPRLRSKAILVLAEVPNLANDVLLDRLLHDSDPRVRANAIEALENRPQAHFVPMLIQMAQQGTNRERANAIKALHRMKFQALSENLQAMLRDPRGEHRISAMWALRQTGMWKLLSEVGKAAKSDGNQRVRRYAMNLLRAISEQLAAQRQAGPGGVAGPGSPRKAG